VAVGERARPCRTERNRNPEDWNRIQLEVDDLDTTVENLSSAGVTFRSEIIAGAGGRQVLADDPSGNPIELFQPSGR